jgi:hypothetical protein
MITPIYHRTGRKEKKAVIAQAHSGGYSDHLESWAEAQI